ncbi:thiamin ABC transporter, ATPase component thiQ [Klebsiella variicola]|uniref:Thiamin ABC transporter, ATPase component thiQ n=1 Tax=Klebsiella variicola TaxID=244366 RepID=A0A7H4MD92_KLEVA|nr:thiamin ABC transporter, ATPase component thiQ [Klebsiella variicola]
MLKLNDVTWLYQHLPMRFTLDVARGERIAVLGPSGAGKSTLLNLIAGFLPPASGSLRINGEVHNATPPAQRPVSMLFQENNLFNHLTVRQNISLGIHPGLKLSREQQAQVAAMAGQMGIDALLERLPGELSGGPAGSARRWPAVWCASSRCCYWMNPSQRLTRRCVRRCCPWSPMSASSSSSLC